MEEYVKNRQAAYVKYGDANMKALEAEQTDEPDKIKKAEKALEKAEKVLVTEKAAAFNKFKQQNPNANELLWRTGFTPAASSIGAPVASTATNPASLTKSMNLSHCDDPQAKVTKHS